MLTDMELSLCARPRKHSPLNQLHASRADARDLSLQSAPLHNQAFPAVQFSQEL